MQKYKALTKYQVTVTITMVYHIKTFANTETKVLYHNKSEVTV
jgi:hypothetical protein